MAEPKRIEPSAATVIDPVCGMSVVPETARGGAVEHAGLLRHPDEKILMKALSEAIAASRSPAFATPLQSVPSGG